MQPVPIYPAYPDQSILMRSYFFGEHTENKEPIPQPEDYQPEPFYSSELLNSVFKSYQQDSTQPTNWPVLLGLTRREDMRQAVISTAPSLQESPGIKV